MAPILETLASEEKDSLTIAKVDTDKYPQLGSQYQIEGLPTFVLFKDGKEVCVCLTRIKHAMSCLVSFIHRGNEFRNSVSDLSFLDFKVKHGNGISKP